MRSCELSKTARKRYEELCKSIPELGKKCVRHANALIEDMWEMAEQVHELKIVCHSLGQPYEVDAIRLCKGETAFHYFRDLYTACEGSKKKALECRIAPYTLLRAFRKERAKHNREKKGSTKAKSKAATMPEPAVKKPIVGKLYFQRATGGIVRADDYDGKAVQVQPLDIDNNPDGDSITVQFSELEGPVTVEKGYRGNDDETDPDGDTKLTLPAEPASDYTKAAQQYLTVNAEFESKANPTNEDYDRHEAARKRVLEVLKASEQERFEAKLRTQKAAVDAAVVIVADLEAKLTTLPVKCKQKVAMAGKHLQDVGKEIDKRLP